MSLTSIVFILIILLFRFDSVESRREYRIRPRDFKFSEMSIFGSLRKE